MVLTWSICTLARDGYIANANVHILTQIRFCSCDHSIMFRNEVSADSLSGSFFLWARLYLINYMYHSSPPCLACSSCLCTLWLCCCSHAGRLNAWCVRALTMVLTRYNCILAWCVVNLLMQMSTFLCKFVYRCSVIHHVGRLHARRVRAVTMVLTCSICTLTWGGYVANANVHILMQICFCSCDHSIKFRNIVSADRLSGSFFLWARLYLINCM